MQKELGSCLNMGPTATQTIIKLFQAQQIQDEEKEKEEKEKEKLDNSAEP